MQFRIGFDHRDRPTLQRMWDQILDTERWSEGPFTEEFERLWAASCGTASIAFSSWSGAALAALEFAEISGHHVLVPSNTFLATAQVVLKAGGKIAWVDCNREDLCVSFEDFERKAYLYKPKAAMIVHIGGHLAFDIEKVSAFARSQGIFLVEDCAHAHGAEWRGRKGGAWGDAGVYSFYATKTLSTGEGGMLVSRTPDLLHFARAYRNYGKPDFIVRGLNHRMSEFTAAIGVVQTRRLEEIVAWKNEYARRNLDQAYPRRIRLPEGMRSGLYKYIVFDRFEPSTGRVYEQPCHRLLGDHDDLPNTEWVARNHSCVPLYFQGGEGQEHP